MLRSIAEWMLQQGLAWMPQYRFPRPELQRTNDLQPMEWGLSYDLGATMEKCLLSMPQFQSYVGMPGARMSAAVGSSRIGGGKRGPPPQLDWLFANGDDLPRVSPFSSEEYDLNVYMTFPSH